MFRVLARWIWGDYMLYTVTKLVLARVSDGFGLHARILSDTQISAGTRRNEHLLSGSIVHDRHAYSDLHAYNASS